jgi:hypothetical protein
MSIYSSEFDYDKVHLVLKKILEVEKESLLPNNKFAQKI